MFVLFSFNFALHEIQIKSWIAVKTLIVLIQLQFYFDDVEADMNQILENVLMSKTYVYVYV